MPERFVRNGKVWKACSQCGVEKPHDEEHYYRSGKRSKETMYYSSCKECVRASREIDGRTDQSELARSRRKRRNNARQKAWVRLSHEYPKRFRELYEEELFKQGPIPR